MCGMNFFLSLLLCALPVCVLSLTCTKCEFTLLPPYSTKCNNTCEGDICYIVVNKHFNGTIIAGCITLREGDNMKIEKPSCHKKEDVYTTCACTSKDKCNDPLAPMADFSFVDEPLLSEYQTMPQVQPMPGKVVPVEPSEVDTNTISDDADKKDEKLIEVKSSIGILSSTTSPDPMPQPNQLPTTKPDLVVTKTVGLKIGDAEEVQLSTPSSTIGQGSGTVEVVGVSSGPTTYPLVGEVQTTEPTQASISRFASWITVTAAILCVA